LSGEVRGEVQPLREQPGAEPQDPLRERGVLPVEIVGEVGERPCCRDVVGLVEDEGGRLGGVGDEERAEGEEREREGEARERLARRRRGAAPSALR